MPTGHGKQMEDLSLSDKQRGAFFKQFAKAKSIFDKEKLYIYRSGNMGDDTFSGKKIDCPAGDNLAVITPNKKVYPCNLIIAPE